MDINLFQNLTSSNFHLKKRLSFLQNNIWNILAFFIGGGVLAAVFSLLMPKEYLSNAVINLDYNSVNNTILSNPGSITSEINLINSELILDNVQNTLSQQGLNINRSELKNSIDIEDENLSTISVSAYSGEAETSAKIANAVAENFFDETMLNDRNSYLFLLKALIDRDKKLQDDFNTPGQNKSSSLNSADDILVTRISEFEAELESADLENQFYQMKQNKIKQILDSKFALNAADVTNIADEQFSKAQQRVERTEIQNYFDPIIQKLQGMEFSYPWNPKENNIALLEKYKTDFNTILVRSVDEIVKVSDLKNGDLLKKLTLAYYKNQIKLNAIGQEQSLIFEIMTSLEDKFNSIPFELIETARSLRTERFSKSLDIKLKTKIENLKLTENQYFAEVESIKKAEVPEELYSPNITRNIFLGLIFGLIGGIIIALKSTKQDFDLVTSIEDLEKEGYKTIAQFDHLEIAEPIIVEFSDLKDNSVKRTKLQHSLENIQAYFKYGNLEKPLKTILITSKNAEEGKSIIAANIAVFLANNNNKVLLVDADLNKPDQSKIFKIKSTPSLAHYLFRKKELEEIIRNTHLRNLDIITCIEFPQNPSVIITSERMKNFMDIVKESYDFVIYDTASISSLKETVFIGQNVDETILIVRANKTKFTEISETKILLTENGIANFDIILNNV